MRNRLRRPREVLGCAEDVPVVNPTMGVAPRTEDVASVDPVVRVALGTEDVASVDPVVRVALGTEDVASVDPVACVRHDHSQISGALVTRVSLAAPPPVLAL